jgi:hypothetical protein
MKRKLILTTLLLAVLLIFLSQPSNPQGTANSPGPNSNITQIGGASVNTDPCGSWGVIKTSKAVNISTAVTTSIVGVSGSTAVFVCGFHLETVSGTTPTFQFEYGTGAACGTGTTVLTGTYTGAALQTFFYGGGEMTLFQAPASNGLCIVSGGTTPNIQGVVTYVQQ